MDDIIIVSRISQEGDFKLIYESLKNWTETFDLIFLNVISRKTGIEWLDYNFNQSVISQLDSKILAIHCDHF